MKRRAAWWGKLSAAWALLAVGGCLLPEVGGSSQASVVDGDAEPVRDDRGQDAAGRGGEGGAPRGGAGAGGTASEPGDPCAENNGGCDAAGPGGERGGAGAGGTASEPTSSGDPCAENNGGCDDAPQAMCLARGGMVVSCVCPGGYEGDGRGDDGCLDIDECATDNGGCDTSPRATCTNRMGAAPSCKCLSASMGDAVGEDGCTLMSPTGPAAGMACGKYSCDEQTVKDPATALTWQRVLPVTYDGCTGQVVTNSGVPGEACAWEQAKAYCSGLSLASGGWRLPTKDELESIVDKTRKNPTIDVAAFPNTPSEDFWSATGSPGDAWLVNFDSGYSRTFIDTACYVRCVR